MREPSLAKTESHSSTNKIVGFAALATAKTSLALRSLFKFEAESLNTVTSLFLQTSLQIAFTNIVLPTPCGPENSTPYRDSFGFGFVSFLTIAVRRRMCASETP